MGLIKNMWGSNSLELIGLGGGTDSLHFPGDAHGLEHISSRKGWERGERTPGSRSPLGQFVPERRGFMKVAGVPILEGLPWDLEVQHGPIGQIWGRGRRLTEYGDKVQDEMTAVQGGLQQVPAAQWGCHWEQGRPLQGEGPGCGHPRRAFRASSCPRLLDP